MRIFYTFRVHRFRYPFFSPHILINGRLPRECNLREMESRRPTRCRAFLLLQAILSPPFSRLWVLRWRVRVVYTRRSDECKRFYLSFHNFQSTCRFAPFTHRKFSFSFILLAAPLSAPCPFLSRHRRSSLSRLLPKITRSFHSPLRSRRVATRFSPALRSYWLLCCVNSALRNEISNSRHRFQPTRFSLFYFCFFSTSLPSHPPPLSPFIPCRCYIRSFLRVALKRLRCPIFLRR